jgi:hypothetical protein
MDGYRFAAALVGEITPSSVAGRSANLPRLPWRIGRSGADGSKSPPAGWFPQGADGPRLPPGTAGSRRIQKTTPFRANAGAKFLST